MATRFFYLRLIFFFWSGGVLGYCPLNLWTWASRLFRPHRNLIHAVIVTEKPRPYALSQKEIV